MCPAAPTQREMRTVLRLAPLVLLALSLTTSAQYWQGLGRGPLSPGGVTTLYGDSVMDALLCGGTFLRIMNDEDTVLVVGTAQWNGTRWDSLGHRMSPIYGNGVDQLAWFLRFNNDLLACSNRPINDGGEVVSVGLSRFNATTERWERLGCVNPVLSGIITLVPKEPTGALYATGHKGDLCGHPERCVFILQNDDWEPWAPFDQIPDYHNNYVGFVFDFQGMTYVTGLFRDPLSTSFCSFMRYNGSTWEYVPGWGPQLGSIRNISIRDNALYVVGTFRTANGAPGNGVARFDGQQWSDLGGGLTMPGAPSALAGMAMEWFHNELWVGGQFTHAGGIPADGLAKWNGLQWCALPGERSSGTSEVSPVHSITTWRDSLYIAGTFTSIDGSPIRYMAQWLGGDAVTDCSSPVGTLELTTPRFSVAPNPTDGVLRLVDLPQGTHTLRVLDAWGRAVLTAPPASYLDTSELPAGTYLLQAVDAGGRILANVRVVRW